MADVSNKDMYNSKMLKAINHIKNISKKKPTADQIHKYLANHDLELEKELLQVFQIIYKRKIMQKFMEAKARTNAKM